MSTIFYCFHNAEKYKESIENSLASYFQQNVAIESFKTTWVGSQPSLLIQGLRVEHKETEAELASIETLVAQLDLSSIFYLWPKFNEVALNEPTVLLESLEEGRFRFAGKNYIPSPTQQKLSKVAVAWLLSQKNMDIYNGEFIWKHREGKQTEIKNFSAQYRTKDSRRDFMASAIYEEDTLLISFDTEGNPMFSRNWDANFEINSENKLDSERAIKIVGAVDQGVGSISSNNIRSQRLVDMVNIIGRGQFLNKWLSASQLQGDLRDVKATFTGALLGLDEWELSTTAHDIKWNAVYGVPGLSKLNAVFRINQSEGALAFKTNDTILVAPESLDQPIPVKQLSGEVALLRSEKVWNWELKQGRFHNDDLELNNLHLSLSKTKDTDNYMVMTSDVESKDLARLSKYLPKKNVAKFKRWWGNAIKEGISGKGTVSYIGSTNKGALKKKDADLILNLDAKNIVLDYGYKQGWPILKSTDMKLSLENQLLSMKAEKATFEGFNAEDVKIDIVDIFDTGRFIEFESDLYGSAESLIRFLQDGPLIRNKKKQKLRFSSGKGSFDGAVQASIPLKKGGKTIVNGKAKLSQVDLSIGKNLNVQAINGEVGFTQNSLKAKGLSGIMLDGPVSADIVTTKQARPPEFAINMVGQGDIKKLNNIISPQLVSRLQGRPEWEATLSIFKGGADLQVTSDLKGVKVDLPSPLGKSRDQLMPLKVVFQDSKSIAKSLKVSAGGDLFVSLEAGGIDSGPLLDKGLISVGEHQTKRLPATGIHINADHESINLDSWLNAITEMSKVKSVQDSKPNFVDSLREINIQSQDLRFLKKSLGETSAVLLSENGRDWEMKLDSDIAVGVGQLKPFSKTPEYQLTLDKLYWSLEKGNSKKQETTTKLNPETFPNVALTASDFRLKNQKLGKLDFNAKPSEQSWLIEKLNLSGEEYNVEGKGQWFTDKTSFEFKVLTEAGGQSESGFNLDDFLVGGQREVSAKLYWPGAPADFTSRKMKGHFNVKIKQGAFPKVNADKGRILGLLNINSLSRRLRLDFEDVFGKGLAFDRLESSGSIDSGNIELEKFFIYSPSVFVESQGKVNFKDELYDLELKVSPQLGGNIALLTALSNPAAGAVVWVVDKMFKGKLNQVVVYSYDVEGSWDSPRIQRTSNQSDAETLN